MATADEEVGGTTDWINHPAASIRFDTLSRSTFIVSEHTAAWNTSPK